MLMLPARYEHDASNGSSTILPGRQEAWLPESETTKRHSVVHGLAIAMKVAVAVALSFPVYPIPGGQVINGCPLPLIAWENAHESSDFIPFPLRPDFFVLFFALNIWFWFSVISFLMRRGCK